VVYECPSGYVNNSMDVNVSQVGAGRRINVAYGYMSGFPCTGVPETTTVLAQGGTAALKKASAVISSHLSACDQDYFDCTSGSNAQTISLQ
jgi:hypothetical protein